IFHSDRELNRIGLATLRFNFRGVGKSEGEYDDGHGETDDVGAAADWMRDAHPGLPLLLVGYSFGSLCALRYATGGGTASALIGIGVPVRIYSFQAAERLGIPLAVVQGSMDEFGSPEEIGALLRGSTVENRLWVVDGADHRFTEQAPDAAKSVVEAARWSLER
ncbi:MAG: alpha/beta fold hydrolase, partial [Acidobacteriota bacterium]|nr:alpha/beta fold hydrolase [Acidobacteriota bacterium]